MLFIGCFGRECDRTLPEELWKELFQESDVLHFKRNQTIIEGGKINRDFFIIKDGMTKCIEERSGSDRIIAFSLPGTIYKSSFPVCYKKPSNIRLLACCDCTVIRVPFEKIIDMADHNIMFANYLLHYAWYDLAALDIRDFNFNNLTIEEKYLNVVNDRPQILQNTTISDLASYIGVSREHLSRMKAKLLRDK